MFLADDGSINEVDLLMLTPAGFFLVEIKSQLGVLRGDAGAWTWEHEGLAGENCAFSYDERPARVRI